ncbi:hypothetical protein ACU4GD_35510 [Cupriavidus basilensis]
MRETTDGFESARRDAECSPGGSSGARQSGEAMLRNCADLNTDAWLVDLHAGSGGTDAHDTLSGGGGGALRWLGGRSISQGLRRGSMLLIVRATTGVTCAACRYL